MDPTALSITKIDRRKGISLIGTMGAALTLTIADLAAGPNTRSPATTVTCFIHYQIDPSQRQEFKKYAKNWGRIVPRCSGHLVGYFLPYEGTNGIAWGLIAFDSLASYEKYRARLNADKEARENLAMAQAQHIVLREDRTFVEVVGGTFGLPSTLAERGS